MARRPVMPPTQHYEWSEMGEVRYAKLTTPEKLAAELKRFNGPDGFKPHQIVEAARAKGSYFHQFFEWDDKKAAENYRVQQARALIASIRIITDDDPDALPRARAFYSVTQRRARGYHDVETIRNSHELQRRLLDQVDRELQQIVDRHIAVRSIAPIIAEARRKLAEERAKYTEARI